ncbi:MAG: hypothetical protein PT120_08575 [Aphanizomenon gracile PMC649.10]|nr:hypothetical protein [Aphanizomenon gracile PMC649.10]
MKQGDKETAIKQWQKSHGKFDNKSAEPILALACGFVYLLKENNNRLISLAETA